MNKNIFLGGVLFLGAVLAGCATTSVSSDYDRSTDFSKLKTYAWANDQKLSGDLRFDDPGLRQTIKQAIETELQAKGLQKVVTGQPDLLLKSYITVEQKEEIAGGNYPPPINAYGQWAGTAGSNSYAAREMMTFRYDDGTFVLDMIEPSSDKILWRGTLEGMVDPSGTREKRMARAPAAVAKVLKDFPPANKYANSK
jgi:hypothetical protein